MVKLPARPSLLTGSTTSYYSMKVILEAGMTTHKRQLSFYADTDTDLFLSFIDSGLKTKVINRALRDFMEREASIDLGDGRGPAKFCNLKEKEKAAICRQLAKGPDKADDHLYAIVQETTTQDFFLWTAKYLALHNLKFGTPYKMTQECIDNEVARVDAANKTTKSTPQTMHNGQSPLSSAAPSLEHAPENEKKQCTVCLHVRVENNSKFTRGRKKAWQHIQMFCLSARHIKEVPGGYELSLSYHDEKELDKQVYDLVDEIHHHADLSNCFAEVDAYEKNGDRHW